MPEKIPVIGKYRLLLNLLNLLINLLRNAGGVNQIFQPQLFARELLLEATLGHARGTDFVEYPVVGVTKGGGEQHHRREIERNKNQAKPQPHKPRSNHKETGRPGLLGRHLQLHSNRDIILSGQNIAVQLDYILITIAVAKLRGRNLP